MLKFQHLITVNFCGVLEVKSGLCLNDDSNLSLSNSTTANIATARVCALKSIQSSKSNDTMKNEKKMNFYFVCLRRDELSKECSTIKILTCSTRIWINVTTLPTPDLG